MKSTLLAVLVISLSYYDMQAQSIAPASPGYIKYQEAIPKHSFYKRIRKTSPIRDGVGTINKLTNDISAISKMADGTASTDKLAFILTNSLENFDSVTRTGKPALRIIPVGQYTYAGYVQLLLTRQMELLSKPRPVTAKKSGWLL
ncbi:MULTISPECIES: hypothetical protein [Niastella]|uniref:Uncharacterized protein n=1 Tax=Niastella soli TaxID=2821487 RepID=A0ABS3YQY9_9BACT|nr:hypothetical protein [Niastella soli]MBO9200326.1 hypothetical protein [Niastella soli]